MLLKNKTVYLGGVDEADFPLIAAWSENESLTRRLDARPFQMKSVKQIEEWWTDRTDDAFRFGIRKNDTDELIGYVELDGVLWTHRTGWVTIAIGEETYWGRGLGKEAMECLIRYAFYELNLHRLQLTVFAYNEPAIRLYASLGFKREGVYREFVERNGKRYDMVLFGLLRTEADLTKEEF